MPRKKLSEGKLQPKLEVELPTLPPPQMTEPPTHSLPETSSGLYESEEESSPSRLKKTKPTPTPYPSSESTLESIARDIARLSETSHAVGIGVSGELHLTLFPAVAGTQKGIIRAFPSSLVIMRDDLGEADDAAYKDRERFIKEGKLQKGPAGRSISPSQVIALDSAFVGLLLRAIGVVE